MFAAKSLTPEDADNAKDQFESFLDTTKKDQDKFMSFNKFAMRLGNFFGHYLHQNKKYAALWKVIVFVFTLSHGQSQIERGFSINNELVVENLKSQSLISQRLVCDYFQTENFHLAIWVAW